MPGSRGDNHPSAPPMTAIVVSKKNLPSFSERRPPFPRGDAFAAGTSELGRSGDEPSNTDVECALRSALGIGHAEVDRQGLDEAAPEPPPQPVPEGAGNVSAEDPAILDWSLCDAPVDDSVASLTKAESSSTRGLPAFGAKRDKVGRAADPSPAPHAASVDPKFPAQKTRPKSSAVVRRPF